jgi:squalene cyclase
MIILNARHQLSPLWQFFASEIRITGRTRLSTSTFRSLRLASDGGLRKTMQRAVKYLHAAQTAEGVWYGSWGICFTYASQFALESLSLVGETYETSPAVRKACDYLVSKQMEDGGWGESYRVSYLARHWPKTAR